MLTLIQALLGLIARLEGRLLARKSVRAYEAGDKRTAFFAVKGASTPESKAIAMAALQGAVKAANA